MITLTNYNFMAMEEGKEGLFFVKADSINVIFGNKIENEQSKYFYTPLKISDVKLHQNEYPIFLYLHKNKIEFRYSGELNIAKDSKDENKSIERLPENEIITINFKSDYFLHIDINEQIKSLVVEEFPILDEYSLSTTIKRNQTLSYINTFQSPSLSHKDRRLNFATLFLNLLFDFKYNPEVFSDDPNFENIKSHFLNSKFIQSILSKAEFYYKFSKLLAPSYLNQSENRLLVKDVNTACKNWLDLLMENRISEVINNKNNWFTDVETEVNNVFKKKFDIIGKGEKSTSNTKEFKELLNIRKKKSSKWLISRTSIIKAWNVLFVIRTKWVVPLTVIYILFLGIFNANNSAIPYIMVTSTFFFLLILISILRKNIIEFLLLRLIFLVTGATYFAFEISKRFNYVFVKNTWTYLKFKTSSDINYLLIITIIVILVSSFYILLNNEKKNHPNLKEETSIKKVLVLMVIILFLSTITNVLLFNTFHFRKELFEENLVIDNIWTEAINRDGKDSLSYHLSNTIDDTLKLKLEGLVDVIENPVNNYKREHYFNENLTDIEVHDNHENKLYPLVKSYNLIGCISIKIVPPVLFINIFITLFLVVFIQIIIHRKKVVDGGHFE